MRVVATALSRFPSRGLRSSRIDTLLQLDPKSEQPCLLTAHRERRRPDWRVGRCHRPSAAARQPLSAKEGDIRETRENS